MPQVSSATIVPHVTQLASTSASHALDTNDTDAVRIAIWDAKRYRPGGNVEAAVIRS